MKNHPVVLTMRLLDWESSKVLDRKKENNTVCSSINSPSNLVNNVFASVRYLGFNIKLLFFFTQHFRSFPDIVSKRREHCCWDFFTRWWEPGEEWFWRFKNFSKLKQHFVNTEHQLKSKIKISMICVSIEYEIKTKMVQEQWIQLKITLFFYWVELTFGGRE